MVVIAWAIASNPEKPVVHNANAQSPVINKYIANIPPAIWAARGRTLSGVSKASVLNNCIPPTLKMGSIAIAITIIPTPPNHCNKALQSRMPGGALSRPTITVEPVVVIPDIDSKNASATLISNSENANGSAPTPATATQLIVVSKKAWRKFRLAREVDRVASINDTPTNKETAAEPAKTCQSGLPVAKSAIAGNPMAIATSDINKPIINSTGPTVITLAPIQLGNS